MSHIPYTRSEIVKRSRDRQKILKEEAQKVGIEKCNLWVSNAHISAIQDVAGMEGLDTFINEAINERLKSLGRAVSSSFPLDEVKMNAFIRQKQIGL